MTSYRATSRIRISDVNVWLEPLWWRIWPLYRRSLDTVHIEVGPLRVRIEFQFTEAK